MRILAIDPGSKRIGIAISDPSGTIAQPLSVLLHKSRVYDTTAVAELAVAQAVRMIIVGQSLDEEGEPTFEGRQAARFADALRLQCSVPVILWDEAFTTQEARRTRLVMGVTRKKRSGHIDELAATLLLQSYLDANPISPTGNHNL